MQAFAVAGTTWALAPVPALPWDGKEPEIQVFSASSPANMGASSYYFNSDRPMRTHSHIKHLPRPQPADVVRLVKSTGRGFIKSLNLGHDEVGFKRLGVGDVDGVLF